MSNRGQPHSDGQCSGSAYLRPVPRMAASHALDDARPRCYTIGGFSRSVCDRAERSSETGGAAESGCRPPGKAGRQPTSNARFEVLPVRIAGQSGVCVRSHCGHGFGRYSSRVNQVANHLAWGSAWLPLFVRASGAGAWRTAAAARGTLNPTKHRFAPVGLFGALRPPYPQCSRRAKPCHAKAR